VVAESFAADKDVEESLSSWLDEGKQALSGQDFGRAAVDFQEALKRCLALKQAPAQELIIRFHLAEALEGLVKITEACEQYRLVIKLTNDADLAKQCQEKVSEYEHWLAEEALATSNAYKQARLIDISYAPLYCAKCKRLFTAGEVYGLRRQLATDATNMALPCYCGFTGKPLIKEDHKHKHALDLAGKANGKRRAIIACANRNFAGGKKQLVAACLAVFLGGFGVHRFYLGERAEGLLYLLFCWTLIPWFIAVFEAMDIINLSPVSFNLTYNVELVLANLPVEDSPQASHADVFSMEITEDPEDFIDEFST
jgi:TM2 domain-containing membrane protein YozV